MIIGKEDDLSAYFWKRVDKEKFAKDMKKVILFGFITIFLSIIVLLGDIICRGIMYVLVGVLLYCLVFYAGCSYRFIKIFIMLVVGKKEHIDSIKPVNRVCKEVRDTLDSNMDTF